jgi:outer membrane receptor for ferrienterochelin and colicins
MRVICVFGALALSVTSASAQQRDSTVVMSLDSLLSIPVNAAARYSQRVENAPASVTIITSEQIERFGYRTLADVLQTVRGVYTSYDRNYTYIGVRGFSRPTDYNNRIVLLLNGHVLNENFYNTALVGSELGLDIEAVDRVEVVRGPGSALYGTGAMFAVVNIVTKRGADLHGGQLAFTLGSLGRRDASVIAGDRIGGLEFVVSGNWGEVDGGDHYYREYDDPETNNGMAIGLDWERYRSALATITWGDFSLQARGSSRTKATPTGAWETAFNDARFHTVDDWAGVSLGFRRAVSSVLEVEAKGFFNHYYYAGDYPDYSYLFSDRNDGTWGGLELQLIRDFGPHNRLVVGGGYTRNGQVRYRTWDESGTQLDIDYPFDAVSAYVQDEIQLGGRLALTGGIRFDGHSEAPDVLTPRFAVIYSPRAQSTLKLLWGESYRAPSGWENFFESGMFKIESTLEPERIRTTEMIWQERVTAHLFATGSLYHYRLRDLIDTVIDPADSMSYFANRGEIEAVGAELSLNGQLGERLTAYANYAVQRAVENDNDLRLTNSPGHLLKGGLSMALRPRLNLAAEGRYESGRETVYGSRTDPVFVTNLNFTTPRLWRGLHASMQVRNAFDADYATPGGFEHVQPAIQQDGRTISFQAGYRF